MKFISPEEIVRKLEERGGRLKNIAFFLFSFIILRNILEGILEKGHLFGTHPYPYHSFLINFIHFPLFYLNVFLIIVLVFGLFTRKTSDSKQEKFLKTAGPVSQMFWIILIPPVIDFVISKGRGYDLSYIIHVESLSSAIISAFNPVASLPGVTIGMKVEIYTAMVLCFIWLYIKRRHLLWSFVGVVCIYVALFFLGILPLLIATIFGLDFSSFYSSGGLLYFDTQKFAAFFFLLFFIILTITLFIYYRNVYNSVWKIKPLDIFLVLTLVGGFIFGFKIFFAIKPNFVVPSDYFAIVLFVTSGFLTLRVDEKPYTMGFAIIGLIVMLTISYYAFLGLLVVVILLRLAKRYNIVVRIVAISVAFFFAFLTGLALFAHERSFSALTMRSNEILDRVKSTWTEEEFLINEIEQKINDHKWHDLEQIFEANPYFVSPSAILYLEAMFHMALKNFQTAETCVKGAIALGYKTKRPYLLLGDVYYRLSRYDKAMDSYRILLARDTKDIAVYKGLANIFFKIGELDSSIIYYERAITSGGQRDPRLFNNLGVSYLKRGEYELAMVSFKRALQLDPDLDETVQNLMFLQSILEKAQ